MEQGDRADELEWQLDQAQRITHIGSWTWTRATDQVVWSDELYRILGRDIGSAVTRDTHVQAIHADDRDRAVRVVGGALRAGRRFSLRARIVRPDGTQRDVEMIGEPTFSDTREATGLIGTTRDITDEIRREQTIRLFTDIVDSLAVGLSVWRRDASGELRLVAANPACERLVGVSVPEHIGASLAACFPAALASDVPSLLHAIDGDHPRRELAACRMTLLRGAPTFAVKAFALPDSRIGLTLEDITQRVRDQRLHFAERRAMEMLAASAPLEDILATIVSVIEELAPETLASVLLFDSASKRLRTGAAASLPAAWNQVVDGVQIGPNVGSCGTAAFRRDAVFVRDVESDPLWEDFRDAVRPFGLRACWSMPILANDGRVLGTFAMYYREPRAPEAADVELIARAVHVAGIAIERRRLDESLAAVTAPTGTLRAPSSRGT
ncbi:MAG: GAF domain-containing protein [Kofleriaceae bacterium]